MKYILTSDWHIRYDIPICRKDNFLDIQENTLEFIYATAKKHNAAVIIAGDIFHRAIPEKSQELEILLFKHIKKAPTYIIAGNHDLKYHRVSNIEKGSFGVLKHSDIVQENDIEGINFYNYSEQLQKDKKGIAVLHRYCEKDNLPEYIEDGITAESLIDDFNYDLYVVGDNHRGFIYEKNNKIVVNCGSITRQTVDQKDYKPFITLYDTATKTTKQIFLPDSNPDDIIDYHITEKNNRDNRINSFIEKLQHGTLLDLSFEGNLKRYVLENKIKNNVNEIILQTLQV